MLNCVFHPVDDMRVVSDDERVKLLASGFWFDSPTEARQVREEIEMDLKNEPKLKKVKVKKEKSQ